ncbi:MAG: alcohol dehydrogenase catalytic domain-containing protein [Halieaceae bacterium]|jgi:threonine dehydrogenase-like Zn-dependent dehydrogenase|nr:alcohol dehydrogenase catalytic domain-containing protein [Halieaceae bacterium]
MKAIRVADGRPGLVDVPAPAGDDGVLVDIVVSSICGSDLHMLDLGLLDQRIPGHEFAGLTPDGTAVAVEPTLGCGHCPACGEGYNSHCVEGFRLLGLGRDGGMAEQVLVPAANLVPLPTGLDIRIASLVEPLAVALHGIDRARVREAERVLVIGGGPVGLAVVAGLIGRGLACDVSARHPHQRSAAESLGGTLEVGDGYDVVIDAVGTEASLSEAVQRLRPMGRIGLVGSFWEPTPLTGLFCLKEIELLPANTYVCKSPQRNFEEAGKLLHGRPTIADALVTHRFPLDAVDEAFATARDRSAGAIKVVFDVA